MRRLKSALRSRPVLAALLTLAVFASVAALRYLGALQPLELLAYDRLLARQATSDPGPVAFVTIGESEINRLDYPLTDATLRRVLERLLEAGPRAIGVDVYRDLPVPRPPLGSEERTTPAYEALGRTVNASGRIYMVTKLPGPDGVGVPPPSFLDPAFVAAADFPGDADGITRRGMLFVWDPDGNAYLSLGLQLALRFLADEGIAMGAAEEDEEWVALGDTAIPPFEANDGGYVRADAGGYQLLLDYRFDHEAAPHVPLLDVLSGEADSALFRDRVVLIGATTPSVKDEFFWPVGPVRRAEPTLYGIELHGHVVDQLVRAGRGESRPLAVWPESRETGWILLWAALGGVLGLWSAPLGLRAALGVLGLVGLVLAGAWLFAGGLWLPVVPPLLAGALSGGLVAVVLAVRERSQVTRLFSRFQGQAVADEIWRLRDQFMEDGLPRSRSGTLTVLISDLQGFTSASEKLGPEGLMAWVSEYLNAMANLVGEHGGVVDDYAGDGIKANFGFPVLRDSEAGLDEDARNSVRCALAMGAEMEALNRRRRERGAPTSRVRIGIHTGPVVVGALGGDQSLKYTSVGDTVNTAARLESFSGDDFGAGTDPAEWRILVGQETRRRLGDAFEVVSIGAHPLKGKGEKVPIHRVLGPAKPDPDAHEEPT